MPWKFHIISIFTKHYNYVSCSPEGIYIGCRCQGFGSGWGGTGGLPCEEVRACPVADTAGSSCHHSELSIEHSWAHQLHVWCFWGKKTCLRNRTGENKTKRALGGRNEKSEKQQNECKVQRERQRCRYLLDCKATLLTLQSSCWSRYQISLKKTGVLEAYARTDGKHKREGATDRNLCVLTITSLLYHLERRVEVKFKAAGKKAVVRTFSFVFHYPNLFWQ